MSSAQTPRQHPHCLSPKRCLWHWARDTRKRSRPKQIEPKPIGLKRAPKGGRQKASGFENEMSLLLGLFLRYENSPRNHRQITTLQFKLRWVGDYLWSMEWNSILLAIALLGLGVAGIAIKILLKPGGEFTGTCASNNPMLRDEQGGCTVCGARPQDACQAEATS